jgi:hypothetical protein
MCGWRVSTRSWMLMLVLVAAFAATTGFATRAEASTSEQLSAMSVTEPFDGGTTSVSSFGSNWSALGWASGSPAKGQDTSGGWRPSSPYATVNGASYSATVTDGGSGVATVATMAANPANSNRYFSLWLDMATPGSTRAGYELRFTDVSAGVYTVTLSKWVGGTQTVLGTKSSYSFANGNSLALVDQGSAVSAWTNTGSGFAQILSATDSAFSSGKTAVEGSGNVTSLTKFKAGGLSAAPAAPTLTSVKPAGPANNNSPQVIGTAAASSTVKIYANSSCAGSPLATGTAAAFASPGLAASLADDSTTSFYATATDASSNTSACSTSTVSYVEDSTAPSPPALSSTSPASPANNNSPKVIGSAASGSTVNLYLNNECSGSAAATGTAAAFASPGLTVSVSDNTTTAYWATATDAAGNVSVCSSSSVSYVEQTCTLTESAPGEPVEMTMPACKLVASDTTSESNPIPFWSSIQCAEASRYSTLTTEGDTHLTATGASQANTAARRMTVLDGDEKTGNGERCELGENDHRTGTTVFYHEGEHLVTYISELANPNWSTVMQMKQTQPSDDNCCGPELEMEARENTWVVSDSWVEIMEFPAKANTWTRFAWDVYYSQNPEKGWVQVSADLNGDGDFNDAGERSKVVHVATLRTEPEGPKGETDGLPAGAPIPSHLRAGIYHNPEIPCVAPTGCSVDVDNVQVIAPQ